MSGGGDGTPSFLIKNNRQREYEMNDEALSRRFSEAGWTYRPAGKGFCIHWDAPNGRSSASYSNARPTVERVNFYGLYEEDTVPSEARYLNQVDDFIALAAK
jgi:hypothetical protein